MKSRPGQVVEAGAGTSPPRGQDARSRPLRSHPDCPRDLDVLFAGAVPPELLDDEETLAFLTDRGNRARWVAAVRGGSLLMGAAGLLRGYRATTNFHLYDALAHLGAIPVGGGQVVEDRNRITAGPATGSFEIGLRLVGDLYGDDVAREMELQIEYDPHPPFGTGSPALAGPELTDLALTHAHALTGATVDAARRTGRRLGVAPTDEGRRASLSTGQR